MRCNIKWDLLIETDPIGSSITDVGQTTVVKSILVLRLRALYGNSIKGDPYFSILLPAQLSLA